MSKIRLLRRGIIGALAGAVIAIPLLSAPASATEIGILRIKQVTRYALDDNFGLDSLYAVTFIGDPNSGAVTSTTKVFIPYSGPNTWNPNVTIGYVPAGAITFTALVEEDAANDLSGSDLANIRSSMAFWYSADFARMAAPVSSANHMTRDQMIAHMREVLRSQVIAATESGVGGDDVLGGSYATVSGVGLLSPMRFNDGGDYVITLGVD
ncbi:hypothetical protein [Streptomyces sp. SID13031]|uniref:hypothetical protein n=1 Tax=Streptomyces sp. SID13031 TaxID=2706046 RepID=UPI0013CB72AB|nr:hypothetical protein [Streptomyces sp. SID13031]NEA36876.1 hypothetical protein [Streptomyces sp. SID13031]